MKIENLKIHYLIKLFVFWLLFFTGFRLLFIIYHHTRIPDGQHTETVKAFIHALPLDIATACILLIIPFVLWSFQQFYKNRVVHIINLSWIIFLIILFTILSIANIRMYGEWGTLLSARAFNYLRYPKEIMSFTSKWSLILLSAGCLLLSYFWIRIYRTHITNFSYTIQNIKLRIVLIILLPILLIIGLRGGFQLAPINESAAYYSETPINNHIATNNIWYLGHSLLEANSNQNPYLFMDTKDAQLRVEELYKTTTNKQTYFLKTDRPNIVFIILESWTADIIQALGGELNVTPHFDSLRKEGILFTQIYSGGYRTDQGLVSIFSGFPAQANNSIITTPSKAEKLPSLCSLLIKNGYSSSFYYGGEIEFANMKTYLINSHFKTIVDKKQFQSSEMNSKWGAHDEHVLNKQLQEIGKEKQPFFSTILTLSTHEPFEVPMQTPFTGNTEAEHFKRAAYYTDNCLATYFKKAKQQPWYSTTLFVLIADHGHPLPRNRDVNHPESRRITCLLTGGALKEEFRNTQMEKICNQNDILATLLKQMNLPATDFKWSKDVFNDGTKEFAYYSNENCLGWITPSKNYVYYFIPKTTEELNGTRDSIKSTLSITDGKAYLQTLYQAYLDY